MQALILEKAWLLVEKEGLSGLTPARLAWYCQKTQTEILRQYPTSLSILLGLWQQAENQAQVTPPLPNLPKDFLFEQLMCVFDSLQPHRLGVKRILTDLVTAPCWLLDIIPYALKWSRQVLLQAGIVVTGIGGFLKVRVFALFCLYMLQAWTEDNTLDFSITMAKLDQGLTKLLEWESVDWLR